MHRFFSANAANARRITAHRQTWLSSNAVNLSPESRRVTERNIRTSDRSSESVWKDDHSGQRASIAVYDLLDAENIRARVIAGAVDAGDIDRAKLLAKDDAPIARINAMFARSGIPIAITVEQAEHVVARKSGGESYSIAELSDGERNALLIAAEVLTVPPGTLLLIDEPERHLHRSIVSPLLTNLFLQRRDCSFIVSTHEVMLPLDYPQAKTLLVSGCTYVDRKVSSWTADLVPANASIPDGVKGDILGGRQKLLFVEGTDQSLDRLLYSLVFPTVSVVPKGSCREVEQAVMGIRDAEELHWVKAFGVVDHDSRSVADIQRLKAKGVYAISVFSVESIYYHPEVQRRVAERQAAVDAGDPNVRVSAARDAAIAAVRQHVQRLSARVAEKVIRDRVLQHLPRQTSIAAGAPINVSIDVASLVAEESARLEAALAGGDFLGLVARYPLRETPALNQIVSALGFQDRNQYEAAVRKLLIDQPDVLALVRSFFGTLSQDIDGG